MPYVDTRYGRLAVPDTSTDVIGHFLARYGEWAWHETQMVASLLPDGARVLDAGAFVGTFGLGLNLVRSLNSICFVEANPTSCRLLKENLLDKLSCSVTMVEAMVAGPGAAPRVGHLAPGNLGATTFVPGPHSDENTPIPAKAATLAELRATHGPFDLIKLDIEGMELEALRGDADHLATGRTVLWMECNENQHSLDLAELLLSWKLDLYYFAFPSFNRNNFRSDPEPIFPMAYEAALLAAPLSHPSLPPELRAQGCILKRLHNVDDLKAALWSTPRWGMPEWEATTDRQELAALVCRTLRGETFDTFLSVDGAGEPETIWQRLDATNAALEEARSLLAEEHARRTHVEEVLQHTGDLALERLAAINAERERREAAEALVDETLQQLKDAAFTKAELVRVSARALAHLATIGELREQVAAAQKEARLARELQARADARVSDLEQTLASLYASTIWRVSAPARAFIGRRPTLRAFLRRGRSAVGRVVRKFPR